MQYKFGGLGFNFFVSDVISGVGFWPVCLMLPGPGPILKVEVFCSSFYWQVQLESEFFEPLIDFLAFLVQK